MDRAFIAYGAVLIMISYFYFTIVLPFMVDAGGPDGFAEEVEAYAFFMHLVFSVGLVLVQFAALPRLVAVGRREEQGVEVAEGEGEQVEPAKGHEKEE